MRYFTDFRYNSEMYTHTERLNYGSDAVLQYF